MNKLFLYFYVSMSLMLGMQSNSICSENHHIGEIDSLMLALKISQEGWDKVKSQIDAHGFAHWIRHDPRDGGCMNGLEWGTQYHPFIIECPNLQRDGYPVSQASSQLSQAVYKYIDEKKAFVSKDKLYNEFIAPRQRANTVDHCTYYSKKNDGSITVYTYFFDKAALVALFNNLSGK